MRIVNKYMIVHCTVYILNIIMMKNQEKGKEVVSKYKGKGGYSGEGLVGTEGNIIFLNYMMKKIVKTKFIHMIHSFFYTFNLHNYNFKN